MTSAAFDKSVASQPGEVARLLAREAPKLDPGRPLVFVGTGTSLHACRVASAWVRSLSGGAIRPAALGAHDLALHEGVTAADQVVVVSHRGNKRYTEEVVRAALEVGATTITISGAGAPTHAGALMLETCAQEAASTHTLSYTSALAVLARLCCALLGDEGRRLADALDAAPEAMAKTLELPLDPAAVDALHERGPHPILISGTGLDAITAEEAALKIKEGTYRWSEGMHSESALHGTPAVYDDRLSAILIRREGDGGRGADLEKVVTAVGALVLECSDRQDAQLPFAPAPDLARPFTAILPLQRLVSDLAARTGASPDQTHFEAEPWRSAIQGVEL